VNAFTAPQVSLGNLDAESAATLIAAAADIALIVDKGGVVRDVAFQATGLAEELEGAGKWLGRAWADLVTPESRPKIADLIRDAASQNPPKWRHINYRDRAGGDIPILFATVRSSGDGRMVAFGRDLRPMSVLQQRLINAQQSMERDYSRIRHVETRYQLLLQTSLDAIFILDGANQTVVEANPQARALVGDGPRRRQNAGLKDIFAPDSVPAVQALLATVRATGRADDVRAHLIDENRDVLVVASLFREDPASFFLVRIVASKDDPNHVSVPKLKSKLLKLVESAPDGFVVTNPEGRIITANAAFLGMAQLPTEELVRGEMLSRWVGRPGVEVDVIVANLLQRGAVRLFATTLQGEHGVSADVEICAASVMNGGRQCFGFAIRNVGRRIPAEPREGAMLPRSIQQLTELIGRVALKDLVRESTDVIERLCIETALEMTGDNRASAAEMLGLSRQSLYVKLRRYGLGDLASEGA